MKRLIVLILLMTVLVACGSIGDADEETKEKEESDVGETEVKEVVHDKEDEPKEESENPKEKESEEPKEVSKDKPVHKERDKPKNDKQETDKKTEQKADKESEEEPKEKNDDVPAVKNEKVEVAAENIIWAQNDRNYSILKGYLGQNITLNEKNNTLKITNVDYPHDADLLKGIKAENIEHRFTQDKGKDHIVGFAVTDYETEMSYTIDLTMRVGKDSWKMLNMQINK